MTDRFEWRERMQALIASHDADVALALVDEAREVLPESDIVPLLDLIDRAWGRAMSLANVDLDTLSHRRSVAIASRAAVKQGLSTSEITALKPRELVAGFLSGSPQPSYVICRKALAWNLHTWAVCEFFYAAQKGDLRSLTYSEGFAPDPVALQRALREVGFPSIADDLLIIFRATSKSAFPIASESNTKSLGKTAPSAEAIVDQAITEAVDFSGARAMGPLLMRRYASLAPGLAEWRRVGAVAAAERWVFGATRPRELTRRSVPAPPNPVGRRRALLDGVAAPWKALGARATNTADTAANRTPPAPPSAVIWVNDRRIASDPGWEAIRATTKPDLNTAVVALDSLPVRLLAVHAAAQLRGAPVLRHMLRLGLMTKADWWVNLAKTACTEGNVNDALARSVEAMMSRRPVAPTLNAASRVASTIPALVELFGQAARLRVPQLEAEHFTLYNRDAKDPSLALSIAFVVATLRAARASHDVEPGQWRPTATNAVRIRRRSAPHPDSAVPPILLMLPDPPAPRSVVFSCLTSLGVTVFDSRAPVTDAL